MLRIGTAILTQSSVVHPSHDGTLAYEPLTTCTALNALALLCRAFPWAKIQEHPLLSLPVSLLPNNGLTRSLARSFGYNGFPKYFVIRKDKKIVAVSGLYSHWQDPASIWLGWTAVEPAMRNAGIGSWTVRTLIKLAGAEGGRRIKVYCNNDSRIIAFYLRLGFEYDHSNHEDEYTYLFAEPI